MKKDDRDAILARGGLSIPWPGEPLLGGWYEAEEIQAAVESMGRSLNPVHGFGFICDEIEEFERAFAEYCGVDHAVSITSAGAGLDLAMLALDLQPGDEVIAPALNFKAGHYSILGMGGRLVLCESEERTLNADPADVERLMSPRTRAILVTHMNGLSAPMDDYLEIADRHPHPKHGPPKVIGDAARAPGAGYKGTKIGKKGWMTVFSLHTMKLLTTLGEGGMITSDDAALARRLRAFRQWGSGMAEAVQAATPEYLDSHPRYGWGGNYKMTKVQAAVGLVQLRRLDEMIARRVQVARKRTTMLQDIPQLTLPYEPPGYDHTYYLYTILLPDNWAGEKRDALMQMLKTDYGVDTVVANPPTYLHEPYIRHHIGSQRCPKAEQIGARLFCPPIHPQMPDADNEYICAALSAAVERLSA